MDDQDSHAEDEIYVVAGGREGTVGLLRRGDRCIAAGFGIGADDFGIWRFAHGNVALTKRNRCGVRLEPIRRPRRRIEPKTDSQMYHRHAGAERCGEPAAIAKTTLRTTAGER